MTRLLLDADYSAIEARIVNWLAGQEDALEEYRQGIDRYKVMASVIYGIPVSEINKFPQRFVGKEATLGCGFKMGSNKFSDTVEKKGHFKLPPGLAEIAVARFRKKHPMVVKLWDDLEKGAKRAIMSPGEILRVGKHLAFMHKEIEGFPFLLMRLPSGRRLAYPRPEIKGGKIFVFRKTIGVTWEQRELGYSAGGTLTENATQAVAGDILCHGVANAEAAGYETATLIHDQALSYYRTGQSAEEFVKLLTDLPAWADGLPIAAEGSLVPFYKKD